MESNLELAKNKIEAQAALYVTKNFPEGDSAILIELCKIQIILLTILQAIRTNADA